MGMDGHFVESRRSAQNKALPSFSWSKEYFLGSPSPIQQFQIHHWTHIGQDASFLTLAKGEISANVALWVIYQNCVAALQHHK